MFASKDIFLKSSGGGYQISRSVRLRSSATAYFNRSAYPVASAGTQWTMSMWVKRGALGVANDLFTFVSTTGSAQQAGIQFDSNNAIRWWQYAPSSYQFQKITTAVFRDPSAWYHLVFVYDTTLATAEDRCQVWINGVRQTSFSTNTNPSQNLVTYYKTGGLYPYLGAENRNASSALTPFDGYLTEINFIDGQALTPSSFGETDSITGVWKPKKYGGTYGTNGFYLNFSDNSGATATTIGKDSSGNGNNWTPNNISVTAGVTYDSMLDVPTLYADGGNGRGNYAVINPLNNSGGTTIADGNLKTTWGSASSRSVLNTMAIPDSGKFYAEFVVGTLTSASVAASFGLATASVSRTSDGYGASGAWVYYASNQSYISRNGTSSAQIGSNQTFAAGGIVQVAVDRTNNQAWLGYNNVWVNATNGTDGNPSAGTNPTVSSLPADLFIIMGLYANSGNVNFGQRPFSYTPPTGFVALNTQNLPTPTISNGATVMAATLYTGNGSTQSISNSNNGVSFQPDLVWIKSRSNAYSHQLFDAVRGTGALSSDLTAAEQAYGDFISYNSNGFTVSITGSIGVNNNGSTFVGWQWKESPSAGFDIVTWTQANPSTLNHNLGVKPAMIIIKGRGTTDNWVVWHQNLTNQTTYALQLNTTTAQFSSATLFNSTAPTSTQFTVGTGSVTNGTLAVAYCFAEVAGYSKFGSYTGNADGPFVFCGFRPRFIMIKRTDSAGNNWVILDTSRDTYNAAGLYLYPNLSAAEDDYRASTGPVDILSNGFKQRSTLTNVNASGGTYIFMAVAENPFKLSLAR